MRTTDDACNGDIRGLETQDPSAPTGERYISFQGTNIRTRGKAARSNRVSLALIALLAVLWPGPAAWSKESSKFPDWKVQWVRTGAGGQYDPAKPPARGQQPPLTPEYQAIWEANIAEGRAGGQYYNPQVRCMLSGMPRMMIAYEPLEVIILPDITYIHITFNSEFRRIYTDGRDWPKNVEPSFAGYSIGKWVDEDGDGRFDVLEVETRHLK